MDIKIFMDLDKFDEKIINMNEEERNEVYYSFCYISGLAKRLHKEGKVSKIIENRVGKIWRFSPHQNVKLMSSKKFGELFGWENPNLRHIQTAINKCLNFKHEAKEELIRITKIKNELREVQER